MLCFPPSIKTYTHAYTYRNQVRHGQLMRAAVCGGGPRLEPGSRPHLVRHAEPGHLRHQHLGLPGGEAGGVAGGAAAWRCGGVTV